MRQRTVVEDSCLNEAVGKERDESNAAAHLGGETLAVV